MSAIADETAHDKLMDFLSRMCHLVSLQPEDITSPSEGAIILGQTGVSLLWTSRPAPSWQVRESFYIVNDLGDRQPVSRLVTTVPEAETVRATHIALILIFERALDIELSVLTG